MDVEDGAGKRRAQHAGLEASCREADVDADTEQDRHAAVEDAFDGSIDRPIRGLVGGCRHKDRVRCHVLLRLQGWVLRAGDELTGMRGRYHAMRASHKPNSAANAGSVLARRRDRRKTYRSRSVLASPSVESEARGGKAWTERGVFARF